MSHKNFRKKKALFLIIASIALLSIIVFQGGLSTDQRTDVRVQAADVNIASYDYKLNELQAKFGKVAEIYDKLAELGGEKEDLLETLNKIPKAQDGSRTELAQQIIDRVSELNEGSKSVTEGINKLTKTRARTFEEMNKLIPKPETQREVQHLIRNVGLSKADANKTVADLRKETENFAHTLSELENSRKLNGKEIEKLEDQLNKISRGDKYYDKLVAQKKDLQWLQRGLKKQIAVTGLQRKWSLVKVRAWTAHLADLVEGSIKISSKSKLKGITLSAIDEIDKSFNTLQSTARIFNSRANVSIFLTKIGKPEQADIFDDLAKQAELHAKRIKKLENMSLKPEFSHRVKILIDKNKDHLKQIDSMLDNIVDGTVDVAKITSARKGIVIGTTYVDKVGGIFKIIKKAEEYIQVRKVGECKPAAIGKIGKTCKKLGKVGSLTLIPITIFVTWNLVPKEDLPENFYK